MGAVQKVDGEEISLYSTYMGLYGNYVFPYLLDKAMRKPELGAHRARVIAKASGRVLEIGFGTGLNLVYYPPSVREIAAVDVSPGMRRLAMKRAVSSGVKVDYQVLDATRLPFPDRSFDTVVSTWTLCSIARLTPALQEVRRVLGDDGRFLFLEHGLSRDKRVATFQRFLEPVNRVIACGCHLTRDFRKLIAVSGFQLESLEEYYLDGVPYTHGYMYEGAAISSA